jgi:hypothetical protein
MIYKVVHKYSVPIYLMYTFYIQIMSYFARPQVGKRNHLSPEVMIFYGNGNWR